MKRIICALILSLLSQILNAEIIPAGNVENVEIFPSSVEFSLSSGAIARIDLLDNSLAQVRINFSGNLSNRTSIAISPQQLTPVVDSIFDTDDVIWLLTEKMMIAVIKQPFRVIALHGDGSLMSADLDSPVIYDSNNGVVLTRKWSPPEEAIFGLGMNGGPINRRGRNLIMRNTDRSDYGEFTNPLYQSYPFYYGLNNGKAYGVFVDSPAYPFFDLGSTETGVLTFGASQQELNYYLIAGPFPQNVATTYSKLTGFNQLPPKWSLGYHHSRYGWDNELQIKEIAEQLRAQDFPTDTLWFDIDYMDNFQKFTWNLANFPSPVQMHQDLLNDGFRSVYINEPCIREDDAIWPFLDQSDYFVKNGEGGSHVNSIWFGNVSWVDYSRDDASAWYKTQLKTFLSTGIAGLWTDLNEPANNFLPDAVWNFNGDPRTETESRNLYALLVNKVAYNAQLELRPNTRPWNFSRGGYSGIQRYAHTWGGDAASTWDSLRVAIQMSISMGISGQNQFGHDTGGFLGNPDGELFTRWLEFSLFTPLFRNHSMNTSEVREPWVYGEPYTSKIRELIKWRYRLLPYIYTLFEEASRTGRPVIMPTFFYAESDIDTYAQDSAYLFGPDLLVAPVHTMGAINRDVYLPKNSQWINFYTDEIFDGGQTITVSAPLGQPPLLARMGAIIPQGGIGKSTDDPEYDPNLSIDIFPSDTSTFTLYEDDGKSFDYVQGDYLRTSITAIKNAQGQSVSIARLDGNFVPAQRDWTVKLHLQAVKPSLISNNGNNLSEQSSLEALEQESEGWFYDGANTSVSVKVPDQTLNNIEIVYP